MSGQFAFWILAAIALGLIEAATFSLVSIWFCVGAAVSAVVSIFTPSPFIQFGVFVVVSAILLLCTRRFVKKFLYKESVPTNADRIIGMKALVTEEINPTLNQGQIKVGGQQWSAKSDCLIPKDEVVEIVKIEGVKAIVKKEEY